MTSGPPPTRPDSEKGHYDFPKPKTIYEFDASTLETVGAPFEGHTDSISGLTLSFDCTVLASASRDNTVKLWAFESRQLLASLDIQCPIRFLISPNPPQLAYMRWQDTKIYICDILPEILASVRPAQPNTSAIKNPRLADLLNSDATPRAVCRKPVISPVTSPVPHPLRSSPTIYPQQFAFLRRLRKLLSSRTNIVQNDQPRDPLDLPATSPLPHSYSISAQETTKTYSRMNPRENSRPTTQSSATATTTFKARLHHLWTARALPPIVDVPLAPGKLRIATAGAPFPDDDLVRDEDYVPTHSSSPNPNLQQPPAVQINTGEHGSSQLCACF